MEIIQKLIDKNHKDSYFYQGLIAKTKDFELVATGDIRLTCSDDPQDDKELENCYDNDHFALNNWFEVIAKDESFELSSDNITGNYDDALEMLKGCQEEENDKWKCVNCGKEKEDYETMYCDKCWELKDKGLDDDEIIETKENEKLLVIYIADNSIEGYIDNEADFDTWLLKHNIEREKQDAIPENRDEFELKSIYKLI